MEDERWRSVLVRLYDPSKVIIHTVVTRPPVPMDRPSYRKYVLKDKPGKSIPMDEKDKRAERIFQASRQATQYLSEPTPQQEETTSVPDDWTIVQVEYWTTSSTGGGGSSNTLRSNIFGTRFRPGAKGNLCARRQEILKPRI